MDDVPTPRATRSRARREAAEAASASQTPTSAAATPSVTRRPGMASKRKDDEPSSSLQRSAPYLPTRTETIVLVLFPAILVFGALFSTLSPETRSSPYDALTQAHMQDAQAPSYFARKGNVFNVYFVKQGWGWTTLATALFVLTHPTFSSAAAGTSGFGTRRVQAAARWLAISTWWFLVTQWCFGPPVIDRGFRWTGGACERADAAALVADQSSSTDGNDKYDGLRSEAADFFTSTACKAAGGSWRGGHDISGHVFLLVLGSGFLLQEVGWAAARWAGVGGDGRAVVMSDGTVKGAGSESATVGGEGRGGPDRLKMGGKFAMGVVALKCWMLLMTAIYFHTWFEKLTGLLTALLGLYLVYIVPRLSSTVRQVVGLPGI